ncbi:hypothetical protein [Bacillus benzoevorans]|uniref:Putative integral membrane protein n=1 Tax=Bacillus benzoevorans TaxID=1456 RepID=A0A7X0HXM3_9BACI|nr:hypothetical protein [Bacillus benzoevorans]MBB6447872.1 putative integral membrane protein [Bacillus benzoevorans]
MESKELNNMRLKQVVVINGLILTFILILFIVTNVFDYSHPIEPTVPSF